MYLKEHVIKNKGLIMLTFTRDDNNTYIVTSNEKFIGRLVKNNGIWCFEYHEVSSLVDVVVPYETSLELTESELENDFNTWLTFKEIGRFGELSHTEYKE